MMDKEKKGKRVEKEYSSTSRNSSEENKKKRMRWCNDDEMIMCGRPKSMDGAWMMPLISVGSSCGSSVVEEYTNSNTNNLPPPPPPAILVLTGGTARKAGTSVGGVDIGVGKSAYFFQVALPGVKKDPGELRCEIERDGKVEIRGVTSTGGKVIKRQSRVFEMKYQQQRPPGPFTLSFSLPGPVDPRLFFPLFRSDGILEAVIAKF